MDRLPPEFPTDDIAPGDLLRAVLDVALQGVDGPLVLAVSGGRDSMALLHAMARWAPGRIAAVATFDHATGSYATEAASLVAAQARRLGLTVVRERARATGRSEAAWRDARWSFLRRVARGFKARVVTAHTRDDQLETIVMRALRSSGARGLAALAAPTSVLRPWLGVSRAELARWVESEGLSYLEDPMNASRDFLRGRVRHELLPAIAQAAPAFAEAMLAIGERAAQWRRDVERHLDSCGVSLNADGTRLTVPTRVLEQTTAEGQAVLWPALCARVGVTLNANGTREAVRFTMSRRSGAHISLAGGATIARRRDARGELFEVRRDAPHHATWTVYDGSSDALPPRFGRWRFRRLGVEPLAKDAWCIGLPAATPVVVRPWKEGDRIRTAGAPAGRRVTRYFTESRVPVLDRPFWPVLLVEGEPLWIPGVCRGLAAPSRPGRPELIWYRCEREFD
ncbi:tRNA lysidine(34) synthetase TilS [Gemmatimonas phototrophica]|uniref:tRNA lysidine(34) synthetase TilS n=1 Tax=Gemmatimonas phototrophica TaxID=1379270 RepID=UPI00047A4D15|nr:tRNA lysidine(34) synthetase TilS [Gemmatimonas phototrophica]